MAYVGPSGGGGSAPKGKASAQTGVAMPKKYTTDDLLNPDPNNPWAGDPYAQSQMRWGAPAEAARGWLRQAGYDPYGGDPLSSLLRMRAESAWNRANARMSPLEIADMGPGGQANGYGKDYMGNEIRGGLRPDVAMLQGIANNIERMARGEVLPWGEGEIAQQYQDPESAWKLIMDAMFMNAAPSMYRSARNGFDRMYEMWQDQQIDSGSPMSFLNYILQRRGGYDRNRTPIAPIPGAQGSY